MSPAVEDYGEKKYLEGYREGVMESQVKNIRALMESLNVDSSKAMDIMGVPMEERPQILEALKQPN